MNKLFFLHEPLFWILICVALGIFVIMLIVIQNDKL